MMPTKILVGAAVLCFSTPSFAVNLNLQTLQACSCDLEGSAVDDAKTCTSDRTHSLVSQEPAQGQNLPLLFPFNIEGESKARVSTTPMCNCNCPSRDAAFSCHVEPQQGDTDGLKNQVVLAYHVGNLPADALRQYIKSFCIPAINQLNTIVKACPGATEGDEVSCSVLNGGNPDAVVVMAASGVAASCERTKTAIAGAICRRDPSLCKLSSKLTCLPQGGSHSTPAAHTIGAALGGNGLSVTNCLSVASGLNNVLSTHAAGEYEDCGVTTTTTTITATTTTTTTTITATTTTTVSTTSITDTSTTTTCSGPFYTSCPTSSQFVVSACYEECSTTSALLGSIVQKCDADLKGDVDGLVSCSGDDVILAGVDGDNPVDCEEFAAGLSRLVERQFGTLEADVRELFTCGQYRINGQPKSGFLQVTASKKEGEHCSDVTGAINAMLKSYADNGACPSRFTDTTTTVSTTTETTATSTTATATTITATTVTGTTVTTTTRSSTTTTTPTTTTITTTSKTTTVSTTTYTGTTVTTTTVTTKTVTTKTATTTATSTTVSTTSGTTTTTTTSTTITSTITTTTSTTTTTTIKCTNFYENKWVDRDGDACSVYDSADACRLYGNGYRGVGNYVANQACCSCGGGVKRCTGPFDTRQECHHLGYDIPTSTTVSATSTTTITATTVTATTVTTTTATATTATSSTVTSVTLTTTTATVTSSTLTSTTVSSTTATTVTTLTITTGTTTTTATTSTISSTTATVSTTATATSSTATTTTVTTTISTTTTEDPIADLECFVPGSRRGRNSPDQCKQYETAECLEIAEIDCCDQQRCDTQEIETGAGSIMFCIPKQTTTATVTTKTATTKTATTTTATTVTTLTTTTAPGADKIAVVSIPNSSPVSCSATVKKLDATLTDMCYMDRKTKIECKRLSATHQMWFAGAGCPDAADKLKELTGRFFSCLDGFITVLKTDCEDVLGELEATMAKVHAGAKVDHGCPTTATTSTVTTVTSSTVTSSTVTTVTTTTTATTTTNTESTQQYTRGSCAGEAEPEICGAVYGIADCRPNDVLAKYLRGTCREMCGTCPTTTTVTSTTATNTTVTETTVTTTSVTATSGTTTTIYQPGHCAGVFEADICGKTHPFVKTQCNNGPPLGDHIRKTCRAMCGVCPNITTTTLTDTTTTATVTSSTVTSSTATATTTTNTTATTATTVTVTSSTVTSTTATSTKTDTTATSSTKTDTTTTTKTLTTTTTGTTTSSTSSSTTSSTTTVTSTKTSSTTTSVTVTSTTATTTTTTTASSTTITHTVSTTTRSSTTTTTTTSVTTKTETTFTTTTKTTTTTLPCLDADHDISVRIDSNFEAFATSGTAMAIEMPDAFRGSCAKMNTLCRTVTPLGGVFYRDWSLFQQCLLAFCPDTCGMCGLSIQQQSWRNPGVQTTCTSLMPVTTTSTRTTVTTQTSATTTTTTLPTVTTLPLVAASANNMASSDKIVIYVVVIVILLGLVGVYVLNNTSNSKSKQQYEVAMRAAAMQGAGGAAQSHPAMTLSPDGDIVLNNMYSQNPGPGGPPHSGASPPGSPGGYNGDGMGSKTMANQRSEVFGMLAASILNDEPTARAGTGTASVVTIDETGL